MIPRTRAAASRSPFLVWFRRIGWGVSITLGLACVSFISVGGMQVVRLRRGPSLPGIPSHPTSATDLVYLRDVVLNNERGASGNQFDGFRRVIDTAPEPMTPDDFTIIASEALAKLENAHSTLSEPVMHRLPIRVHWLAEGLIIVKSRREHADLLGQEILEIGGVVPEELSKRTASLVGGGTRSWIRYRSEYFITAPVALRALGADVSGGGVMLRTITRSGKTTATRLVPDTEPSACNTFLNWRDALPGDAHCGTEGWLTVLKADSTLPLYQRDSTHRFLVCDVPDHDAVYVRMNGSVNDSVETAAHFIQRVNDTIRRSRRRNTIVDFRYNWGGGYELSLPLAKSVADAAGAGDRIYLITGPNTFSAGLIAASQLKRYAGARLTVVGEDVGDRLRFRAEGMLVTMPATRAEVYITTSWDDVANDCSWFADCWPLDKFLLKGIGTLAPDLRAANTWDSYMNGRDAVVEAVFADIARRH